MEQGRRKEVGETNVAIFGHMKYNNITILNLTSLHVKLLNLVFHFGPVFVCALLYLSVKQNGSVECKILALI
jgi:hypothetical protein